MVSDKTYPYKVLFILISVLVFNAGVFAQSPSLLVPDTVKTEPTIIPVSEISIQSTKTISRTNKRYDALISSKQIEVLKSRNDSLVSLIDSIIRVDMEDDLTELNFRQLRNEQVFWQQIITKIQAAEILLSARIQSINEERLRVYKDIQLWKRTKNDLTQKTEYGSIIERVDEMITFLLEADKKMEIKGEQLLLMLDKATGLEILINQHLENTEKQQLVIEAGIYKRNHSYIFNIEWGEWDNWNIKGQVKEFYRSEVRLLNSYLKENLLKIFFQLLIIVVLIIIFRALKKQVIETGVNQNSLLGRQIARLFTHSALIAVLLGAFVSEFLFTNQPELLYDIVEIFLIVPLLIIIYFELNRSFGILLILLGFLPLMNSFIEILSPDNLVYRLIVILIILTEIGLVLSLFRYLKKNPISKLLNHRIVIVILTVYLFMAFIAVVSIVIGATALAHKAIQLPLFSTLSALLFIVLVIIIGGLIEIGMDSPGGKKLNFIRLHGEYLKSRIISFISLAAALYWIYLFLQLIRLDRIVFAGIANFIKNEITVGSASFALGDIFVFILVIWISVLLSRALQVLLENDVLSKFKLKKGIPYTIGLMVRYSIITAGVFLAVSAAGMPVGSMGLLFGALGVGIGFGLQNIFNNLVSGLILLFERPIQLGDTIQVGELMGNVKSIGIRSSNVRTFDGAEVIVPNGQLISKEVVNWTLSDQQRRIEVLAGVAYGSDPHLVKKVLIEGLEKHPDIIDKPAPEVYFNDLGESSLNFRLLFWTNNIGEWLRIKSEVVFMVHDTLKEHGIKIPYPQRDVHLYTDKGLDSFNDRVKGE